MLYKKIISFIWEAYKHFIGKINFNQIFFKNFTEDVRLNQFVIRVYDLNENHNEIEQQTEKPPDADDSSEKQTIQPKFEYFLDKSTKYYEVTSSRIRIQ